MSATSDRATRHVELLTDTVAAVSSSLDLAEVLERIASRVADAMATDACFLYLYDEATGMLELRRDRTAPASTTPPTGRACAPARASPAPPRELRHPVMIPTRRTSTRASAAFPNLPEDEYESILAVPVLARDHLAGALNVRTRSRASSPTTRSRCS